MIISGCASIAALIRRISKYAAKVQRENNPQQKDTSRFDSGGPHQIQPVLISHEDGVLDGRNTSGCLEWTYSA